MTTVKVKQKQPCLTTTMTTPRFWQWVDCLRLINTIWNGVIETYNDDELSQTDWDSCQRKRTKKKKNIYILYMFYICRFH